MAAIYINNSNIVELQNLRVQPDNIIEENASVTLRIQDETGTDVPGQVWPTSMQHEGNGVYVGTVEPTVDLQPEQRYIAVVVAVGGGGQIGTWNYPLIAVKRRFD